LTPNRNNGKRLHSATLDEIAAELGAVSATLRLPPGTGKTVVDGVSNDSRNVRPGDLFVAISGTADDGGKFVADALRAGASAIIHQGAPLPDTAPENAAPRLEVADARMAYALLAEMFQGHPARRMELCAITGTNGKTTTAFLLREILAASNGKCALISTVERSWPGTKLDARWTTPDPMELQKTLADALDAGCGRAVLEASSHALHQKRLGSAKCAVAIFTNLSGDHLDYHRDMESYYQAKKILFDAHLDADGTAVVNVDDPAGKRLFGEIRGNRAAVSLGTRENDDFKISNMETDISGTSFSLRLPSGEILHVETPLVGNFNAFNAASAAVAAISLGVPPKTAADTLRSARGAPGRMEKVASNPLVVVDYAHTDDALRRVLSTLRSTASASRGNGGITVVFGCGGDRDKTKRPRMAAAAAEFADAVVVTNDNPRTEPAERIIEDILAGFPKGFDAVVVEPDREKAIGLALRNAGADDTVLIAGKGHETYQETNGVRRHFDDREAAGRQLRLALEKNRP
jgi:UDP-N-acetylmuramoyl-L-alanyl-D-glutamate--2,6-diaminopimelate ligase